VSQIRLKLRACWAFTTTPCAGGRGPFDLLPEPAEGHLDVLLVGEVKLSTSLEGFPSRSQGFNWWITTTGIKQSSQAFGCSWCRPAARAGSASGALGL